MAIAGEAGVIASGDDDLLVLDPFRKVHLPNFNRGIETLSRYFSLLPTV